jgi:hypothetical protein
VNGRQESKMMTLKILNSLLNSNDAQHSSESSKFLLKTELSQYRTQFEILGDDI